MTPPVPAKCDGCSRPLADPLICSRCKAYAYCGQECQAKHWKAHKSGCSALPAGKLVPAKIKYDPAREAEVRKVNLLLQGVIKCTDAWSSAGAVNGGRGEIFIAQVATGNVPAYEALRAYQLPAAFTSPPLAGQPASPSATQALQLKLRHIARLFFLHHLSKFPPAAVRDTFLLDRPAQAAAVASITGSLPGAAARARLHGPKVLAVPDKLSMDEYGALGTRVAANLVGDAGPEACGGLHWPGLSVAATLVWELAERVERGKEGEGRRAKGAWGLVE